MPILACKFQSIRDQVRQDLLIPNFISEKFLKELEVVLFDNELSLDLFLPGHVDQSVEGVLDHVYKVEVGPVQLESHLVVLCNVQ